MIPRVSSPRFLVRYNYVVFLIGILLLLIGAATSLHLFEKGVPRLLDALAVILFVFGVWSLPKGRVLHVSGLALLTGSILLNAIGVMQDINLIRYISLVLLTGFLCLTIYAATKHILTSDVVDMNRLFGATCVYLLLGLIFGNIYFFLNAAVPGAFSGLPDSDFLEQLMALNYHSFVTLTTLGYGDIYPVLPLARTLCYLEAVLGQMYLTILVAALVGIHIAMRQNGRGEK